jgi:hypothetical protein
MRSYKAVSGHVLCDLYRTYRAVDILQRSRHVDGETVREQRYRAISTTGSVNRGAQERQVTGEGAW